jgi:hypothetical protein
MKKVIGSMAAAGLLLASLSPIFAWYSWKPDLNADVSLAKVRVTTLSTAVTGQNTAVNQISVEKAKADDLKLYFGKNEIHTGNAYSDAHATTYVNKGSASICDTCAKYNVNVDAAKVNVYTEAVSLSGVNEAANTIYVKKAHVDDLSLSGYNKIWTGKADADSSSFTVVNAAYSYHQ